MTIDFDLLGHDSMEDYRDYYDRMYFLGGLWYWVTEGNTPPGDGGAQLGERTNPPARRRGGSPVNTREEDPSTGV